MSYRFLYFLHRGSLEIYKVGVSFQITANKMQLSLVYLFLQTLYMFQAVSPPIIMSTQLYIQRQILPTVMIELNRLPINLCEKSQDKTCMAKNCVRQRLKSNRLK
jgi:hypothetical protein